MKFGLIYANIGPFSEPHAAVQCAQAAEAAGFESIWTVEHTVVPVGYAPAYPYNASGRMPGPDDAPIPDPIVWLSFVAAATTTIRLGTGVLILPQRNPVVLAKALATLDHLSGGRMLLGAGVGWLKEEFDAIGIPFAERGHRADEAIALMRALWREDRASYAGRFNSFEDCICRPQPANGAIPIHIGGHTEAAARRAGRIGDGFFPAAGDREQLADAFELVRSTAEACGRDPSAIELSGVASGAVGPGALEEIAALAELGVARVMLPALLFWKDPVDALARYGEEVIARS